MTVAVVTGSRDYTDYPTVADALDAIHSRTPITEIRHGAAPGADALASRWAHARKINVNAFGAQWGTYGSNAGPVRNRRMLDTDPLPAIVLAFPTGDSRGTWGCVREANERHIPVIVVEARR